LEKHNVSREANIERVGRLKPEEKVNMAIDMTEAMVEACVGGIRAENPNLTEEELLEMLRRRLRSIKKRRRRSRRVK
jgi:hypothetical protein